ncbi:MAG: hypothetical protein WBZ36_04920 [Candidatus Nitrosopolaris sp.]
MNSRRVIKCVTCGKHYFELSGKALTDEDIDAIYLGTKKCPLDVHKSKYAVAL